MIQKILNQELSQPRLRSFREEFEDGSIGWENGAKLVMAVSADVSWVTALVRFFSESSNSLLISLNTSTSWIEQLVVCGFGGDFGRGCGLPVLSAVSPTVFTFGMLLRNYQRCGKSAKRKQATVQTQKFRRICGISLSRNKGKYAKWIKSLKTN